MSATRYQIGFPSISIQSIAPTTGASRRVTKRQPDGERSTENARTKSDQKIATTLPAQYRQISGQIGLARVGVRDLRGVAPCAR